MRTNPNPHTTLSPNQIMLGARLGSGLGANHLATEERHARARLLRETAPVAIPAAPSLAQRMARMCHATIVRTFTKNRAPFAPSSLTQPTGKELR